jgi:hypothetical protein
MAAKLRIAFVLTAVMASPVAVGRPLPATVVLHDHGFAFRDIGFRSKAVQLTVVNRGKQPHALAIVSASSPGTPIKRTQALSPGQSTQLSFSLPPGNYRMYSPLDRDRARGLSAPMKVMSPGVKGGAEMNRVFYNF